MVGVANCTGIKKRLCGSGMIRFTISSFSILSITLMTSFNSFCSELDEVLGAYYSAIGGIEKLAALETFRASGTYRIDDVSYPMTVWVKGDKMRLELTLGGKTNVKIFDGSKAWEVNSSDSSGEARLLKQYEVRKYANFRNHLGLFLFDWRKHGHDLNYLGTVEKKNRVLHQVQVNTKFRFSYILFLDSESHLPVMIGSAATKRPRKPKKPGRSQRFNRRNNEQMMQYLAFASVDGLKFPSHMAVGTGCKHSVHDENSRCGIYREIHYTNATFNPELDDRLFDAEAVAMAHN